MEDVILESDDDAWWETEYLSRGANGRELRRRAAEMEAGEGVVHELVESDAEPSDADYLKAAALEAYRQMGS